MKLLSILVAGVLLGGCARSNMQNPPAQPPPATPSPSQAPAPAPTPAPAPSAAVDPAGVWDYTADAQGQTLSGTLELNRVDGRWTGVITNSAIPDVPVTRVSVQGQVVTLVGGADQGEVTIQMTVTGNEFTGTWSLGGDSGPIRGSRR